MGYLLDMTKHEQFPPAAADRAPTADEEAAAERGAATVDVDEVAEHYEEMSETGANIRGEGQIERNP
jgi:hypothetical protein